MFQIFGLLAPFSRKQRESYEYFGRLLISMCRNVELRKVSVSFVVGSGEYFCYLFAATSLIIRQLIFIFPTEVQHFIVTLLI